MGFYLNSKKPGILFQEEVLSTYFVDKTEILEELIPLVELKRNAKEISGPNRGKGHKYVCITRPRRFGKTVMANMISSYFGKGKDSHDTFAGLKISQCEWYERHMNQHHVIHIMLNEVPDEYVSYPEYISRIKSLLQEDLIREFPDAGIRETESLWDSLNKVIEYTDDKKFIFILDEWDYIFQRRFVSEQDKEAYVVFLSTLLKDQPYVEFVYMTGILPITKYSSGSELNMFYEYTMATREKFSEYFGFTDEEVDELYQKYLQIESSPKIEREALKLWYDGYQTMSGRRLYNPRSVVGALSDNQLGNYWTSSGPYDEISYYVKHNVDQVRDDLAFMASGMAIEASVQEYAATSMELTTRDEIFSAMVVYGFLSYENGCVSIPNKELMDKFADMLKKEPSLGYVYRLAKESGRMLQATKAGDTKTMSKILQYVHHTESPLLYYNNEAELAAAVRLAYLEARDTYQVEREDQAGVGYVDFIFYPVKENDDCIILELKVDHTAEEAIQQIKDRNYMMKFQGRLGEKEKYTGRILAVGIAYNKKDKEHECKVEILRGRQIQRD